MGALRRGGGPDTERAISVYPCALLVRPGAEVCGGVERASVDVAGLDADNCWILELWKVLGADASLSVHWQAQHTLVAEACHAQAAHQRRVRLIADDDGDGRRAEETVGLDIPAYSFQDRVTRCKQRGEIRRCRAG